MALLDKKNKVIYWDGVNWQWLPYVLNKGGLSHFAFHKKVDDSWLSLTVTGVDDLLPLYENEGFVLQPFPKGLVELSKGVFLYSGVVVKSSNSLYSFLSSYFGVSLVTVYRYTSVVKSLDEMLTISVKNNSRPQEVSLLGVSYPSVKATADAFGCSHNKVSSILQYMGSLPDELICKYLKGDYRSLVPVRDSSGDWYVNAKDASKELGLPYDFIVRNLKKSGFIDLNRQLIEKKTLTVNGVSYNSINEFARAIKKDSQLVHARYNMFEKSSIPLDYLFHWKDIKNIKPIKDHLGNWFPTRYRLAEHYGVPVNQLYSRIRSGWTIEEALTGKRNKPSKPKE